MTCEHGFIGACVECDGSGQIPESTWNVNAPEPHGLCEGHGCSGCDWTGSERGAARVTLHLTRHDLHPADSRRYDS